MGQANRDRRSRTSAAHVYRRRWLILGVLTFSVFIVVLDDTVIVVALPVVGAELEASTSELQWIMDAYLLVFAGLLLPAGSLGDRLGRRAALLLGLGVFGLGSAASAYSPSVGPLIAARAMMGIGAACIMPTTLSILTNVFPPEERVRAIAIWSGIVGVAVGVGPAAGGWLMERFWWGAAFLINVPVVIATILLACWLVPESRDRQSRRLDVVGALLSISGLGLLLFAIIDAPVHGWVEPRTVSLGSCGLGILAVFALWERRIEHPMVDIRFFRSARFTVSTIALMLTFFSLLGLLFVSTQLFQDYHGYSPAETGVRIAPVAPAIIGGALISPRIVESLGTKLAVFSGLTLLGVGISTVAVTGNGGYLGVLIGIVSVGGGMGIAMAPATDAIMGSLPAARSGVGSAINDTTRQVGAALGVAAIGSVLTHRFSSSLETRSVESWPEIRSLGASISVAAGMPPSKADELTEVARLAFVDAMHASLLIAAGAAFCAALLALALLPARETRSREEILDDFLRGTLPRGTRLGDWLLRPNPSQGCEDDD